MFKIPYQCSFHFITFPIKNVDRINPNFLFNSFFKSFKLAKTHEQFSQSNLVFLCKLLVFLVQYGILVCNSTNRSSPAARKPFLQNTFGRLLYNFLLNLQLSIHYLRVIKSQIWINNTTFIYRSQKDAVPVFGALKEEYSK